MSLEEKMEPLDIQSYYDISRVDKKSHGVPHSNLFIPPQTTPQAHRTHTRIRFQMCSGASSVHGLGVTFIPSGKQECPPGVLCIGAWCGRILGEWCV